MLKIFTLEELRGWTPEKRKHLYDNARKTADGQYIVDIIERNGLALSSGALSTNDPVHLKIVELAWSTHGREAMIEATKNGIPALCGLDPLLQAEIGDRYGKHDLGTAVAGTVVAEVMRHLGYRETGQGKCPAECTAKTGLCWTGK
jgi:hypothetical protein